MNSVSHEKVRFEKALTFFAFFAFAFYTHALDRVLSGNGSSFLEVSSSPLIQLLALMNIYLASLGHVLLKIPKRLGIEVVATVFLVLFCLASTLWSSNPELTFKRSISIAGALLTLSFLYRALGPEKLWDIFVLFSAGFVAVLFVLMIIAPGYAFHNASDAGVAEHAGRFRGFYFHKNEAARFGLMTLMVLFVSRSRFRTWVWVALMACAVAICLATQSSKIVVALLIALFAYWFFTRSLAPTIKVMLLAYALCLAILLFMTVDINAAIQIFAESLGRDASFSGRDVLWSLASVHIQENPILGRGLYAGWPQAAIDYLIMLKGPSGALNHAHNGYLQLLLDLGFVGLALTLFPSLLCLKRLLVMPANAWGGIERFSILFLSAYFVLNASGSYLLVSNDIFHWLILFLAVQSRPTQNAQWSSVPSGKVA